MPLKRHQRLLPEGSRGNEVGWLRLSSYEVFLCGLARPEARIDLLDLNLKLGKKRQLVGAAITRKLSHQQMTVLVTQVDCDQNSGRRSRQDFDHPREIFPLGDI